MPVVYRDALESQSISIVIHPDVGYTQYAGLRFEDEVTVNIWETGVAEADGEGIGGTDSDGTVWFFARVMVEGEEAFVELRK